MPPVRNFGGPIASPAFVSPERRGPERGDRPVTIGTATEREAVPEGWPPPTPVELLRMSRGLGWLCATCTILTLAAIVVGTIVLHNDLTNVLHAVSR